MSQLKYCAKLTLLYKSNLLTLLVTGVQYILRSTFCSEIVNHWNFTPQSQSEGLINNSIVCENN